MDASSPWPRRTLGRRGALSRMVGSALGLAVAVGHARSRPSGYVAAQDETAAPEGGPALRLRIATPPAGSEVVDLRRDFGAAGDGIADDAPAFLALAGAVDAGQVPPGAVVLIPAGRYRVVGNAAVTFRRPIILHGVGPAETIIRLEYSERGSGFLRVVGQDPYVLHATGVYSAGSGGNRYPSGPYAEVRGVPLRGDLSLGVERPELFAPGDQAFLLCDDYGAEVAYSPTNIRSEHFLLKQHLAVREVDGSELRLDTPLRHDFAGAAPRLYRWRPLVGFGLEHLTILDRSEIPDGEAATTFRAVRLDSVVDGWVWDVHFLDNTSIPLSVARSRRVVVCEALFHGARHVGGGGNGYLPELYLTDDSLVEYCTSVGGRHALICNWSCWGNAFRYNRVVGTPNTETHGEYSVENLYLRNDARGSRMEVGGGGTRVHGHDGPRNELRENYARTLGALKAADRDTRLIENWHHEPLVDRGTDTLHADNRLVPPDWDAFPFATFRGHDHAETAETARP